MANLPKLQQASGVTSCGCFNCYKGTCTMSFSSCLSDHEYRGAWTSDAPCHHIIDGLKFS
eukprot:603085-Pelagomonas_calceolata.AAC.2